MLAVGVSLRNLRSSVSASALSAYKVLTFNPELVFDFENEKYFTNSLKSTFSDAVTHTRASNATMVDSDGVLKWAPHNIALNSAAPATQSITVVSGADYTVECTGVSIALSGAGTGTVTEGNPVTITASTTTLTLTVTGSTGTMWVYRSDLGGMVDNPDRGDSYVPTTSVAVYLPRRGHHVWDGSEWVNEGLLHESEARTNLLLNSGALATQDVTVTAVPHTLHFTGTGTVTLSGASTDGPLVGTGTGENNRVSLTFTPTAGTLTLTVSGTVTYAQLEAASTPSSYIPTSGSTVTRAAETLTVPSANLPWPEPVVIGPELVTNGTFDTDISGWSDDSSVGGSIAWNPAGYLDLVNTTGTSRAGFAASVTAGKVYQISVDVVSLGGSTVAAFYLDGSATSAINFATAGVGTHTVYYVTPDASLDISVRNFSTGTTVSIDNISVREIDPLAVSIQMDGRVTYADTDQFAEVYFWLWYDDANNQVYANLRTNLSVDGGRLNFWQVSAGEADSSVSADVYTPGVLVPHNIASRHGSIFINGAVDGTALTENTTPTALPDLSATDLSLGYDYMGTIKKFRMWAKDLGDTGIEDASA